MIKKIKNCNCFNESENNTMRKSIQIYYQVYKNKYYNRALMLYWFIPYAFPVFLPRLTSFPLYNYQNMIIISEPPNPKFLAQFIWEIEEVFDPPIEVCDPQMKGLGFLHPMG